MVSIRAMSVDDGEKYLVNPSETWAKTLTARKRSGGRLRTRLSRTLALAPEPDRHGASGSIMLSRRSSTPGRLVKASEDRAASVKSRDR